MFRTHGALLLALSILAASGCGEATKSSSHTVAPTTAKSSAVPTKPGENRPLTKKQLIAKADAICLGINAKRASTHFTTTQDFARSIPPLAAYEQAAVGELRKLVPPPSMAQSWNEIVASAAARANAISQVSAAVKINPHSIEKTQSSAAIVGKATEKITTIAKREGFADCARVS